MNDIDVLQDRIAELEYALREMYENILNTKTLRDEFAIAALQGIIAGMSDHGTLKFDDAADYAFEYADAMLKTRYKEEDGDV